MITITRQHSICAGHRVVNQGGKCENLHGHQYEFFLTCTAAQLNDIGMILDFSELKNRVCKWLDDNWDHKMLIWDEDPWREALAKVDSTVVWVPFNPTAENIAAHIVLKVAPSLLLGTGVNLVECRINETSKCTATFTLENPFFVSKANA